MNSTTTDSPQVRITVSDPADVGEILSAASQFELTTLPPPALDSGADVGPGCSGCVPCSPA